jgi:hypothetical protein
MKKFASILVFVALFVGQSSFAIKEFVYHSSTETHVSFVKGQLARIMTGEYQLVPGSVDLSRYLGGLSLIGAGVTTVMGQQINHYIVRFQAKDKMGRINSGQIVLLSEDVTSGRPVGENNTSAQIESVNGAPKGKIRMSLIVCSALLRCDSSRDPAIGDLGLTAE